MCEQGVARHWRRGGAPSALPFLPSRLATCMAVAVATMAPLVQRRIVFARLSVLTRPTAARMGPCPSTLAPMSRRICYFIDVCSRLETEAVPARSLTAAAMGTRWATTAACPSVPTKPLVAVVAASRRPTNGRTGGGADSGSATLASEKGGRWGQADAHCRRL